MTLLITKQTGNYFSFVLNGDTANEVSNDQNRLLTQGSLCNFKTGNGANIIKEQNISFSDITLIAGGTFTFASVDELWLKLIEVGFFDGLGSGGGTGGVDRFDELLDTFTYFGHANEAVVVNSSETGLTSVDLYNYSKFVELSDTPNSLVPNKMVVVNSLGTSLILVDQPQQQQQFLNSVGYFNYADTGSSVSFVANTEKKLTNDTLGADTDISQSPFGIATVWNTDTNKFDFSQMDIGDTVDIRIDLNLANAIDKVFLKIGSLELPLFNSTLGIGLSSYITQVPINSNAKTNGAEVYIKSSINGTLTVVGFYTRILRKNINVVTIEGGSNLSANITSYDVTVESSTGTNATIPSATISSAGVMSASDKGFLDSIPDPALKQDKLDGIGLVRGNGGFITYDQNKYLTANDLPSTLTLYPTTAVSDVSGYFKLVNTIEDPDFNAIAVDVSTGAITIAEQLISSLITVPNLIDGDPGVFNTTTIGNIRKVSGTGEAEFFFRVYKRTVAGVEDLVATSSATLPVTNSGYSEFQATALWDDGLFIDTDRIVVKFYANRISGGVDPVYSFQFGGNTPVRTIVPIPTAVIPNIFLGDLSDVEDGVALDREILVYNGTTEIWDYESITDVIGYIPENTANKGVPNGYASLDGGGLVPQSQLPSYVDDILEFADLASFPAPGETGKIYIAISPENLQYRWSGTGYVQITNGLIATTNDLPEGGFNLYFTVNRVLNSILTGLSTASSSVITAADTVLSALGKLQGQVSLRELLSNKQNSLTTDGTGVKYPTVDATNGGIVYKRTIAQIRSFTGVLPNNYLYTTDLGQEGNWYYDPTDTASLDNTGSVLVTADGKRIKRIYSDKTNVKWFGALGDGLTDDTTEIQNALNSMKPLDGGTLYFPEGAYLVTDEIIFYSDDFAKDVNILGQSRVNTKIKMNADINKSVFQFYGVSGSVKNLTIEGYRNAIDYPDHLAFNQAHGVKVRDTYTLDALGSSHFEIEDCEIYNFRGNCINIIAANNVYVNNNYLHSTLFGEGILCSILGTGLVVTNNRVEDCYWGIDSNMKKSTISQNRIKNVVTGITYENMNTNEGDSSELNNVGFGIISNNFITDFTGSGINVSSPNFTQGVRNVKILNNYVKGDLASPDETLGIHIDKVYDLEISGNTLKDCKSTNSFAAYSDGIFIEAVTRCKVYNNIINNAGRIGIALKEQSHISDTNPSYVISNIDIHGNYFENCQSSGVNSRQNVDFLTLENNNFTDTPIGYFAANTVSDIVINGNDGFNCPNIIDTTVMSLYSNDFKGVSISNTPSGSESKEIVNVGYLDTALALKQNTLTNPVTGAGVSNYISKFTGSSEIGSGSIFDDGTYLRAFTNVTSSGFGFEIFKNSFAISDAVNPSLILSNEPGWAFDGASSFYGQGYKLTSTTSDGSLSLIQKKPSDSTLYDIFKIVNGNFLLGTTTDTGEELQVNGTIKATTYTGGATLTGTPQAPTAALGTNTSQIATTEFVQSTRPYKVYTALLTQSGSTPSDVPVATVLENTLGGTVSWSRNGPGSYQATLTSAFVSLKTALITTTPSSGATVTSIRLSNDVVTLNSFNNTGSGTDGLISEMFYEIRVYN